MHQKCNHTALTHIFIFLCCAYNAAIPDMQERLRQITNQLQQAAALNQRRGEFTAISDCVASPEASWTLGLTQLPISNR